MLPFTECERLTNPEHGQAMPNSTVQFMGSATYSCEDGFQLLGDKTRICQSDGSWSGREPNCSEKSNKLFGKTMTSILEINKL